jgi:3-mercaptopyruvate sulfurtransferase SseA
MTEAHPGTAARGRSRRLGEMGIEETKGSVTVKVNRGAFPARFFFAAMKAIGVEQVRLEDV